MLYGYSQFHDVYKDTTDVETRFDISNYESDKSLPKDKNKKIIGLMKDELGGKIMTELVGLRAETYSYLLDDDSEDKKAKGTQICVINRKLKLNHKNRLGATQLDNKKNYLEKNQIDIVCKKIIKNS